MNSEARTPNDVRVCKTRSSYIACAQEDADVHNAICVRSYYEHQNLIGIVLELIRHRKVQQLDQTLETFLLANLDLEDNRNFKISRAGLPY